MEISGDINNRIFARLQDLRQEAGSLPAFIQYFYELLAIQEEVNKEAVISVPGPDAVLAADRIHKGIPVLSFDDFKPDWCQVQVIFKKIAMWTAGEDDTSTGEYEALNSIGNNPEFLKTIFKTWYGQDYSKGIPEVEKIDSNLLDSIITAAFKPFLNAYSRLLMPMIDQEQWQRHYCPVCGGRPDFSYLDKERGARWLVCSRCDTEWRFLRLACPYCGTQNEDELSYLTDEGGALTYRLYVCKNCSNYIKAIDLRHANSDVLLPLERVITLGIDQKAQEMGYHPGWLTPSLSSVPARLPVPDNFRRY